MYYSDCLSIHLSFQDVYFAVFSTTFAFIIPSLVIVAIYTRLFFIMRARLKDKIQTAQDVPKESGTAPKVSDHAGIVQMQRNMDY